jgi:hypothetical protein
VKQGEHAQQVVLGAVVLLHHVAGVAGHPPEVVVGEQDALWCAGGAGGVRLCGDVVVGPVDGRLDIGVFPDLVDKGDKIREPDDRLGPAVRERVADFAGLVLGVHRDDSPTGPEHPVIGDDKLREVGEIHAHAVAGLEPRVGQRRRELAGLVPELLVDDVLSAK